MLFRDVDGQDKLAFVKDANGRLIWYIDFPFMVFQKIENPLNKAIFNYLVLGFSIGVLALTLLLWPLAAILVRNRQAAHPRPSCQTHARRFSMSSAPSIFSL